LSFNYGYSKTSCDARMAAVTSVSDVPTMGT
jgi:hypothetical protein